MFTNESISKFAEVVRSYLAKLDEQFTSFPLLKSVSDNAEPYLKATRAVELLGGCLSVKNEGEWQDTWGDGTIRGLVGDSHAAFVIAIPSHTTVERDFFTIAHELGHLFLHLKYGSGEFKRDDSFTDTIMTRSGRNATEYEANHFAACLLMPEDDYRQIADQCANDVARIASYFGVSPSAALMRGKFLGIFPW